MLKFTRFYIKVILKNSALSLHKHGPKIYILFKKTTFFPEQEISPKCLILIISEKTWRVLHVSHMTNVNVRGSTEPLAERVYSC